MFPPRLTDNLDKPDAVTTHLRTGIPASGSLTCHHSDTKSPNSWNIMAADGDDSKSFLERLPVEIFKLILSELDDFQSLSSAIFSCRAVHSAFTCNKSSIARRVLVNQVDIQVLPEAISAFEASRLHPRCAPQEFLDFVARHFSNRSTRDLTISGTVTELATFARLDIFVRKLALMFADDCLAKAPAETGCDVPPTLTEKARICRALYRFETFCYLSRRAPFNEVAAHDVAWGEHRVERALSPSKITLQGVLSKGLVHLYRLGTAKSYEEKYAQLAVEHPPVRPDFLHRALTRSQRSHRNGSLGLSFFNDPDPGPSTIWEWAYSDLDTEAVYLPDRAGLREWGYVMWDQARIDKTKLLQSPWRPPSAQAPHEPNVEVADEDLLDSWTRRSQIYAKGGRGWWDAGDETKIVWRVKKKPRRRPQRAKPMSLEEAKQTMLSLSLPSQPSKSSG
ncbi:hypothetical protein CEP54_007236 [Fusarium duplospermum]|uniref:F-box domain-containing protein n=1 Tax=Fusarium duplospermum TaxID=1325734 RepID=A0A428Q2L5_9HYPO|nr:hypothetical protein CEP54_007236 [Fusarium duplospermum]